MPAIDHPGFTIALSFDARVPGQGSALDSPPIPVVVTFTTPPSAGDPTAVPAIGTSTGIGVPTISSNGLTLAAPDDQATIATSTPTFAVTFTVDDEDATYTIEVQYSASATFSAPTTLTVNAEGADGGAVVTPATPLPAHLWWRARLFNGTEQVVGWSTARSLTVSTTVTATTLPVTWTVSATAPRPIHLWHLNPAGPEAGDVVTVYGQGFPASGTLQFGTTILPTVSWQKIPASADDNTGTDRTIDGSVVDCEHDEIVFIAPTYHGPGAALSVEA